MTFVHLCGHSTYSLLESIGSLDAILSRAQSLGMKHIAVGDYNGLYGAVNFFKKAKDYSINPLVGVELTFVFQPGQQQISGLGHTVYFLAKNFSGYQNLSRLISQAYQRNADSPWICLEDLTLVEQDVFLILGGVRSWVYDQITRGVEEPKLIDSIGLLRDAVGDDSLFFAIGIQSYTHFPLLKATNDLLLGLASEWGVTSFASGNFHYPLREDRYAAEVALAIKDGRKMYDEERRKIVGEFHIQSEEEVVALLQQNGVSSVLIEELMTATMTIAESISLNIPLWQSLFPNYEPSEDMHSLYGKYADTLVE